MPLLAPAAGEPVDSLCMATLDGSCSFRPLRFARRPLGPADVLLESKYVGMCHTDVHVAAGHAAALMGRKYPCVPGHELAGVVAAVGAAVTRVRVGDAVGVGCMVDSCGRCGACRRGEEQWCMRNTMTYNGVPGKNSQPGPGAPAHTLGGYTTAFVVDERFAVKIPQGYPLEAAGPVMCAGVTVFDPLRRHGAGPGTRLGVVGIGGLGAMAVKLGKALGCVVTAITRSPSKAAFAARAGADASLISTDAAAMAAAANSLDLILDTAPDQHDLAPYLALLARGRTAAGRVRRLVVLGLTADLVASMVVGSLTCGTSRVVGGNIGSVECTQAVLDLCAAKGIAPELKVVPVEAISEVYAALSAGNDTGLRYVLDLKTLDAGAADRCRGVAPPNLGAPPRPIGACSIVSAIFRLLCCRR